MMKLLYVPTGNIFTLPDEEALAIKREDRGNYRILDAGYVDEVEEQADEKTIAELVMGETAPQVELPPAQEEAKQEEIAEETETTEEKINIEDLKKPELVGLWMKLGIKVTKTDTKEILIGKIKATGQF